MIRIKRFLEGQKKAIFIGGCPRSGTTLLGSLLGGAQGYITTPESQFIIEAITKIYRKEISENYQDIISSFCNNFRFNLWGISQKNIITSDPISKDVLVDIVWQCVDLYALKIGKTSWHTWVDHTPSNIEQINFYMEKFPDSYFIHIIRDGRGVFSSVKSLDWGPNGAIEGAMWWGYKISTGLAAEKTFGDRILRVKFEEIIFNPEKEIRKICNFAGVEFNISMLNGDGFVAPEYTKKQHKLIGKSPDKSVCDKWKSALNPREIEIFENKAGPLLEYLKYDIYYGLKANPPTSWERYLEILYSWFTKPIVNYWLRYRRRKKINQK